MIGGLTTMLPGVGAALGDSVRNVASALGAPSSLAGALAGMNPFDLRTIDVCHNFAVFIGGVPVGEFHAVEGLTRTIETKPVSEGGRFDQQVHMIKQHTYGELTLKWGLVQRGYMYNWMEEVKPGNRFRRDLVIMLQDRMLIPTRVFSIIGAFPTEWTSPNMDAQSSNVPVETLKLRYHSMEMVARHVI